MNVGLFVLRRETVFTAGRAARFFLVQNTKSGKMYQMATKCSKWPQNVPNGKTFYQVAVNRPNGHTIYQHLSWQDPPKLNLKDFSW
jgi:hypothetical protein